MNALAHGLGFSGRRQLRHTAEHRAESLANLQNNLGLPTSASRPNNLHRPFVDELEDALGVDVPDSERDGEYKSFRAGNSYKLVMTFESGAESWDIGPVSNLIVENYDVEIKFWARYPDGDRLCSTTFTARGSAVWEDRREYEFQMPDLLSEG